MDCDNNCPVCLEELKDNVYITPCNHKFCKECITRWMSINRICPYCRQSI